MRLIYQLGIKTYLGAVRVASLFNEKARLFINGRKGVLEYLEQNISNEDNIAWFHVSSLGEFEQGRPVIEALKKERPEYKVLLTFFSPSGYEIRKDYSEADWVVYLPVDSNRNAKQFLDLVKPKLAFFVKYDFWYFYLKNLSERRIPVYIFSSIFRAEQLFFKSYGKWYRKMLRFFTHLYVQDQQSVELLNKIGVNNVTIGGDTRFDRVLQIVSQAKDFKQIETFVGDSSVIIGGSTWDKDEQILFQYINNNPEFKLIIAPHEIHEHNIQRIIKEAPCETVRFTKLNSHSSTNARILIVDTMGMLSSIYRYGNVAYIGGGFGKGIHNTLEAATYGIPVVFGPNYKKFKEACDLIDLKAAFSVENFSYAKKYFDNLLGDEKQRKQAGELARNYVKSMAGGTQKILKNLS